MPGSNRSAFDITQKRQNAPINPAWITSGTPVARNQVLFHSSDRSAWTMLWDCSAGEFRWRYSVDETIHFLDGAVTITDSDGTHYRFGPGDVVFFPAGAVADWKIDTHVRKLAFCQRPVPRLFKLPIRLLRRLDRLVSRMARVLLDSLSDPGLKDAPGKPPAQEAGPPRIVALRRKS